MVIAYTLSRGRWGVVSLDPPYRLDPPPIGLPDKPVHRGGAPGLPAKDLTHSPADCDNS
jgi:hypothetical protein